MDEDYIDVTTNESDEENVLIFNNNTPKRKRQQDEYVEFEHFETEEDWFSWMAQQNEIWSSIKFTDGVNAAISFYVCKNARRRESFQHGTRITAQRLSIGNDLYKAAWELKKKGRLLIVQQNDQNIVHTVIMPSAAGKGKFADPEGPQKLVDAVVLYQSDADFENWDYYKRLRAQFHIIRRCQIGKISSCAIVTRLPTGGLRPCKHSVFAMCMPQVDLKQYPPEVTSQQLTSNRKGGRPKKVGPALNLN